MDETGFMIGQGGTTRVISDTKIAPQPLPSSTNRESVTVTECVSAGGSYIPPFIIFKGKSHSSANFANTLPGGTR
jgi:hypothetical protein